MRSITFLSIIMLATILSWERGVAQESAAERYDSDTIYLEMDWWRTRFVQNGEAHKTGFMYRNLTGILEKSPRAHEEIQKFRKRQKIAYVFYSLSLGLSLAAWITHRQDKDDDTRAYVIGDIATMTISRLFSWAAKGSLNKAIWIYNRDVVAGTVASVGVRDRNTAAVSLGIAW